MSDNPGPNGVPPQPEASPGGVEFMLLEAAVNRYNNRRL